jgi:hypothetical protein
MGKQYREIVRSRKLAERSYLYFKYPNKFQPIEFYLPFMENIEVNESQRPNYATYDLIGRAGSLYAYLGSKSREMTLKFNITLPNIIDYIHNVGLSPMFSNNFRVLLGFKSKSSEKEKFFKDSLKDNQLIGSNNFDYYGQGKSDIRQVDDTFIDGKDSQSLTRSAFQGIADFFNSNSKQDFKIPAIFANGWFGSEPAKQYPDVDMGEAVNYLMMWVNVIRTAVINNSVNTQYGPPTIYLNHGTMYNNIPCVCTGIGIKIVDNAGYELLSLAPRRVEVTMNLSENRTGDFDKFTPFDPVKGDNLTGWESIVSFGPEGIGTMDPNNQFLRVYRQEQASLVREEEAAARKAAKIAEIQQTSLNIINF